VTGGPPPAGGPFARGGRASARFRGRRARRAALSRPRRARAGRERRGRRGPAEALSLPRAAGRARRRSRAAHRIRGASSRSRRGCGAPSVNAGRSARRAARLGLPPHGRTRAGRPVASSARPGGRRSSPSALHPRALHRRRGPMRPRWKDAAPNRRAAGAPSHALEPGGCRRARPAERELVSPASQTTAEGPPSSSAPRGAESSTSHRSLARGRTRRRPDTRRRSDGARWPCESTRWVAAAGVSPSASAAANAPLRST
jgi:hypothetical protein